MREDARTIDLIWEHFVALNEGRENLTRLTAGTGNMERMVRQTYTIDPEVLNQLQMHGITLTATIVRKELLKLRLALIDFDACGENLIYPETRDLPVGLIDISLQYGFLEALVLHLFVINDLYFTNERTQQRATLKISAEAEKSLLAYNYSRFHNREP